MASSVTSPSIGPFPLGMDNRLPDHALYDKDERAVLLRSAVNVDVTNNGTLRRRKGSKQLIPGSDCHSLFSTAEAGFFVDGTSLKRLGSEDLTVSTLRTDLTAGLPMSFAEAPTGGVYYTNTEVIARVLSSGALAPMSVPAAASPTVSVIAGTLPAGRYQVAVAFVNEGGEVGPASTPVQIELADVGGLTLADLAAAPEGVSATHIYMTATNGETLMRVATTTATAWSIASPPMFGARCFTLHRAPMPAGSIVRLSNGRVLVAAGNFVFYSDPYSPLYTPSKGFIPFPTEVTVVEPCAGGVYIVADQAYWLAGDIAEAELKPVLPYGALARASGQIPNENSCWWMSARGAVIADGGGKVRNMQEKRIDVGAISSAVGGFVEVGGLRQVVVTVG